MQWARDVVAEHHAALIRNVTSLLTATTHVMVVGTDADRIAVQVSQTPLDVAETAIGILTRLDGDAVNATVISTTTAVGDATGK
jgi:hypothetical protein